MKSNTASIGDDEQFNALLNAAHNEWSASHDTSARRALIAHIDALLAESRRQGMIYGSDRQVEVFADAGLLAARAAPSVPEWQPIETAPTNGRTLLLGCFNKMGNWRTMRGQWFTKETIDNEWEEPDGFEDGWYETAVEPDAPNCWSIAPTHWMPLPLAPAAPAGINQQAGGAVPVDRDAEIERLQNAKSHLIQQASIWCQEARCQRHTVISILQALGLPEEDWDALSHVLAHVAKLREQALTDAAQACSEVAAFKGGENETCVACIREIVALISAAPALSDIEHPEQHARPDAPNPALAVPVQADRGEARVKPDFATDEEWALIGKPVEASMDGAKWFAGTLIEVIDLFAPYRVRLSDSDVRTFSTIRPVAPPASPSEPYLWIDTSPDSTTGTARPLFEDIEQVELIGSTKKFGHNTTPLYLAPPVAPDLASHLRTLEDFYSWSSQGYMTVPALHSLTPENQIVWRDDYAKALREKLLSHSAQAPVEPLAPDTAELPEPALRSSVDGALLFTVEQVAQQREAGRQIGFDQGWAAHQKAPRPPGPAAAAPVEPVSALTDEQEPKYGGRLFNRASGETIPPDEPVFIFRARDKFAVDAIAGYMRMLPRNDHRKAVLDRVNEFQIFKQENPDRMKEPDTDRALLAANPKAEPVSEDKRDATLEDAVQAVAERAGESETMLVINAFAAIRSLKKNRFAPPSSQAAIKSSPTKEST